MSSNGRPTVLDDQWTHDRVVFIDHGRTCAVEEEVKVGTAWRQDDGAELEEAAAMKLHTTLGKWLIARGYDIR